MIDNQIPRNRTARPFGVPLYLVHLTKYGHSTCVKRAWDDNLARYPVQFIFDKMHLDRGLPLSC